MLTCLMTRGVCLCVYVEYLFFLFLKIHTAKYNFLLMDIIQKYIPQLTFKMYFRSWTEDYLIGTVTLLNSKLAYHLSLKLNLLPRVLRTYIIFQNKNRFSLV